MAKATLKSVTKRKVAEFLAGRHPFTILALLREGGWGDPHQRERHPILLTILIFIAAFSPTLAFAQACADLRPSWDPASGPVTALQEAGYVFGSTFGLVTIGVFLLAILTFKTHWLISSAAASLGLAALLYTGETLADPTGMSQMATQEGCSGPPTIAIAICLGFASACGVILWLKRTSSAPQP